MRFMALNVTVFVLSEVVDTRLDYARVVVLDAVMAARRGS